MLGFKLKLVERLGFGTLDRMGREMSSLEFQLRLAEFLSDQEDYKTDEQIEQEAFERDALRARARAGETLTEEEIAKYGHSN